MRDYLNKIIKIEIAYNNEAIGINEIKKHINSLLPVEVKKIEILK